MWRPSGTITVTTILATCGFAAAQPIESRSASEAAQCAPRLTEASADSEAMVIGAQDGTTRSYFGRADVLVVSGGERAGLDVGQQLLTWRPAAGWEGAAGGDNTLDESQSSSLIETGGIVRVVAIERDAAIAEIVRVCAGIRRGDRLGLLVHHAEAMTEPPPRGMPDYEHPGVVLYGEQGRSLIAERQHFVLSLGTRDGLVAGQRLTIFRKTLDGLRAVTHVGDAVVTSTTETTAAGFVSKAMDVIERGDLVAPHR